MSGTAAGRLAVVMPALDEERSIGGVLDSLDRHLVDHVVVADNGSRDRTADVARSRGAQVVAVPERGYGAACAGALENLPADVDLVVFMDADGADDPADLPHLIAPIRENRADLVIGSRVLGRAQAGALTPQQRLGNRLATFLIHRLCGHRYTDLGPFRAVRRDALERLGMQDRRYGWTVEMQLRALEHGLRVSEVPVSYRRRVGASKISGTVSGVLKAGWWILYTIWRHAPRRRRRGH